MGGMEHMDDLKAQAKTFVEKVTQAMGLSLTATVIDTPDGPQVELSGDDGEVLLRRKGEALQALQHVLSAAFRDRTGEHERVSVDCMGFRRDKDAELCQMARYLAEKSKTSGMPQELGPLNPYERRLVHMTVAEDPTVSSESIGDAFQKTVIITARKRK
jgi:spoIIIJ-associated protein